MPSEILFYWYKILSCYSGIAIQILKFSNNLYQSYINAEQITLYIWGKF